MPYETPRKGPRTKAAKFSAAEKTRQAEKRRRRSKDSSQTPIMIFGVPGSREPVALSPEATKPKSSPRSQPGSWDNPTYMGQNTLGRDAKRLYQEAISATQPSEGFKQPTRKKKPYTLLPGFKQPRVKRPTLLRGGGM